MPSAHNILDYGARPGGDYSCTPALLRAVAAAVAGGGGEVLVPHGTFLTGSFALASRVTLRLNGVLLASTSADEYPASGWDWDPALIDTHNATDVGIVGAGRIEGQAVPKWVDSYDPLRGYVPRTWAGVHGCVGECRPKLVRFTDCTRVTLAGDDGGRLGVSNAPDWSVLLRRTSWVRATRLHIHGDERWPNGDGIDVESGEHIHIEDVDIDVGDDAICISSGNTNPLRTPWPGGVAQPVRNLTLRNATLRSRSSAIKLSAVRFGGSDHGDISDVTVASVRIVDSSRGIGFQQRAGSGDMHGVRFEDVSIDATRYPTGANWWGSGEPIWITSVPQNASEPGMLTGTIRDITFRNVVARGENGVLVSGGGRGRPMERLVFDNVSMEVGVFGNTSCSKGVPHAVPSGCRDYRPRTAAVAVVPCGTSAFTFEGNGSVVLRDVAARFEARAVAPSYWLPGDAGGLCGEVAGSGRWSVRMEGATRLKCLPVEGDTRRAPKPSIPWSIPITNML